MRHAVYYCRFLIVLTCLFVVACTLTPEPLTRDEVRGRVSEDVGKLFADQEPINGPITLSEAIARAIKYNLDHRVGMMESTVSELNLDTLKYDMLPELTANAGYTNRNNEPGSKSQSLIDGSTSLGFSKSQPRIGRSAEMGFSWNILDFGVSYFRAKQEANMALVAEERRRKVIQNITQDVRYAFWRALTAQNLIPKVDALLELAEQSLDDVRKIEEKRLQDPLAALSFQKVLLETVRDLTSLRWQLKLAKVELAALINIHPNSDYELVNDAPDEYAIPQMNIPIDSLEDLALNFRPELREEDYNQRISKDDVYKEYLKLFPGLTVSTKGSWEQNRFLYNNSWFETGLSMAWNLIDAVSLPDRLELAEAREDVVKTRRLAITMAVLSQVNISYQRFEQARKEFDYASQLDQVDKRILEQTELAQKTDLKSRLEFVQSFANALLANLRKDVAYAELHNALGAIYVSIGADLLPADIGAYDVGAASQMVATLFNDWQSGRFTFNDQDIVRLRPVAQPVQSENKIAETDDKPKPQQENVVDDSRQNTIEKPVVEDSSTQADSGDKQIDDKINKAFATIDATEPSSQPQQTDNNLSFNIPGYEAVQNDGRAIVFRKIGTPDTPPKPIAVKPKIETQEVQPADKKEAPKPKQAKSIIRNFLDSYLNVPSEVKEKEKAAASTAHVATDDSQDTEASKEDLIKNYLGE